MSDTVLVALFNLEMSVASPMKVQSSTCYYQDPVKEIGTNLDAYHYAVRLTLTYTESLGQVEMIKAELFDTSTLTLGGVRELLSGQYDDKSIHWKLDRYFNQVESLHCSWKEFVNSKNNWDAEWRQTVSSTDRTMVQSLYLTFLMQEVWRYIKCHHRYYLCEEETCRKIATLESIDNIDGCKTWACSKEHLVGWTTEPDYESNHRIDEVIYGQG